MNFVTSKQQVLHKFIKNILHCFFAKQDEVMHYYLSGALLYKQPSLLALSSHISFIKNKNQAYLDFSQLEVWGGRMPQETKFWYSPLIIPPKKLFTVYWNNYSVSKKSGFFRIEGYHGRTLKVFEAWSIS